MNPPNGATFARYVFCCATTFALSNFAVSGAARAETVVISQKDKTFSQKEITIAVNDTVEFHNLDDTAHSILSLTPGMEFDLKTQRPGELKSRTFDKPGQVVVTCDIHLKMALTVNVK